jgi:hypothetical protein
MHAPPPRAPRLQPLVGDHLNQRLDQLQAEQRERERAGVARRLRLLRLQQENLVQQRELLQENDVPDRRMLRNMERQLRELEQVRDNRRARRPG